MISGPSRFVRPGMLLGVSLGLLACGDDDGDPVVHGEVEIRTQTQGASLDPDGYSFILDNSQQRSIGINDIVVVEGVEPGQHSVQLSGLAPNCAVAGDNPVGFEVSGDVVVVPFDVSCFPIVNGQWVGQYSVTGCTAVGATDPLFCDEIFYFGSSLGLELDLAQSGPELAGDGFQGTLTGEVSGAVDQVRFVTLGGTLTGASGLVSEILAWEATLAADSLIGSWTFRVEDQTTPALGVVTVDADFKLVGPSVATFSNCPVELDLTQNDEIAGFLGAGDCQILDPANADESYFDLFAVDVQTGDSLAVELVSEEFSTFLLIVDEEERALAADPNPPFAGADTAFLALEAVVDETWLIVANTYLNGETGNYSLVTERLNAGGAATPIVPRPVRAPRERLISLGEDLKTARASAAAAMPLAPRDRIAALLRGGRVNR